jgi:hypothetical protein
LRNRNSSRKDREKVEGEGVRETAEEALVAEEESLMELRSTMLSEVLLLLDPLSLRVVPRSL